MSCLTREREGFVGRSFCVEVKPILNTERLTLRPFTLADAVDVQRLAGDFAIADTTLNVAHPYEDGMAEAWISSQPA